MKLLLALLFTLHACAPAYAAPTRTVQADQIQTPDLTKLFTFPAATAQLVGTSSTQALTNKDIDGGTASNTSRLTLPKAATGTLTALTRKQGTIVYDTTLNKPYYDDGSNLIAVGSGSGSGGVKNYITGGDAESGTTGFATYADAAGTSPVDGTGGSPSVTWTTTAVTPLAGTNSFLLTKGATNRQGDGVSYAFTIDSQDKAKVLSISFNYMVNSGTFVAGTSSTASDVTVWIYDVTNATIIQPSSIKLLSNSATLADKFSASFQTASNSTSYRLIFHVGSTSAAAYSLMVDTIEVSPSTYVYGTPITDWVAWTPTGSWTTNTTYTGLKRQVGDNYEYQVKVATSGAPTATGLTITTQETIDVGKLIQGGSAFEYVGSGAANDSGTAYALLVAGASTNTVQLRYQSATSGATSQVTHTTPFTFGASDYVTVNFAVPILGKSSSVQMSDQTDTRVVAVNATKSSNQTGINPNNSAVKITIDSATNGDTHGMLNVANNRIVARVPGWYDVTSSVLVSGTNVLANLYYTVINKNGTTIAYGSSPSNTASVSFVSVAATKVYLNLDDYLELFIFGQGNNSASTLTATSVSLAASRTSGPSAIAATESVNLKYSNVAGTSVGTGNVTLTFPTKIKDTHGLFTSNTTATAQIPGMYSVYAKFTANTIGGLSTCLIRILVNGVTVSEKGYALNYSTASPFTWDIGDDIPLNAGDAVTIQFQNGFGSSITTDTGVGRNSFAMKRVGN
jgi:hypothetical protein